MILNIKLSAFQLSILMLLFGFSAFAQKGDRKEKIKIDGQLLTMYVTEQGDTLLLANLDELSVSAPRNFDSNLQRIEYEKLRRYAVKVYPYAVEAIKVFREVEYFTNDMKKRERKKHVKKLQKDLETEFEEPLKKLTRTQGKVLIKMIERELEMPLFKLIKDMKGGFAANYWNIAGSLYGHHIRSGYTKGEEPILDILLEDFDISYELPR